jgi:hypothetical protein
VSAEVAIEYIYSAWCASCAWGDGRISTTEEEAEAMVDAHNREEHGDAETTKHEVAGSAASA